MRDSRPDQPTSTQPAGNGEAPKRTDSKRYVIIAVVIIVAMIVFAIMR